MVNLTFGEQVKIILSRKGMTIKELAEQMEAYTGKPMSRQNMTQRLHRDNFQEQDMRLIAKILGCQFELSIMEAAEEVEEIEIPVVKAQVEEAPVAEEPVAEVAAAVEEPVVETVEIEVPAEPEEDTNAREITVEELIDFTEPEPEVEEKTVPSFAAVKERDEERNILRKGIKGYFKKHEPVEIVEKTEIYFLLDSLDNLHKGGRIGKASQLVGSLLNIKPILCLKDGVISAYEKVRGNKGNKAQERLIDILIEKIDPDKEVYCVIGYCDNLEVSQHIQERLEGKIDCDAYVYLQIGSVVGTHIGMGATGMAFYQL